METIEIDPSSGLLTDSGLHYFRQGNYEEAIKRFSAALETSPNQVKLYRYLGEANARIKDYERMAECFRKVVHHCPQDLEGWQNLAKAYEALDQTSLLTVALRQIRAIRASSLTFSDS